MKIISSNVNNFGGLEGKPLIKDHQKPQSSTPDWNKWKLAVDNWREVNNDKILGNVDYIFNYINNSEIVVLQEVNTNCNSFIKLKEKAAKNDFSIVYPNGTDEETFFKNYNSITCMLVKKIIVYNKIDENFSNKKYKTLKLRWGN